MKRLFLTGVVGLLGIAGPVGAAVMTGAGAAPAGASPKVALYHMPVIGKHVLPDIVVRRSAPLRFNGTTSATSTNWSGYAATGNTFANLSSSWVQPSVTCPTSGGGLFGLGGAPTSYSSFWVGLDGYTSSTVEQTGTDSDCDAGKPSYYAWYEMYPAASVDLSTSSNPVNPGDTITGTVVSGGPGTSFTLELSDTPAGASTPKWTFSIPESAGSTSYARSSAEWVAEAPSECSVLFCSVTSLADFGNVTFSNAVASTSAQPTTYKPISSYANSEITMTSSSGSVKATPTSLNAAGNGFSVHWNAS
jgi:hypothetical protein